ncbi:hypothetical protein QYE76_032733 [Lolium multiflorum]|uniref:Uncharacterized protein n=1 Tax=Lolium multiflorum TaxID=4521 RepID=A0AAD8QU04_LOLMU|nr:hypothetical protein QYE76_032733 [Lolium multiflorum]
MEDQAGAENAEENEAAIQLEEIEAAIQHEEIEAAIEHEEIEPMDREQREQMDVEWLQPMSPEEREQTPRRRQIIEAIAYNIASTAQIQHSMSEPVDVSLPLPSSDPLLMKDTKTAAVPTVVIDATNIEAIAYNIASTAQIQHSMSEPVDVSLPLPSSDPLLMKDTKTAAVPTVVIDATNIEAIAYNIASTAQIQHSMSEPVDVSLPLPSSDPLLMKDTKTAAVPRVRIDAKTIEAIVYNRAAKPPIQPSADPSLMKYTKTAAVPTVVIDATNIEAIADNIASTADGADDHPSAARRPGLSCPSLRGRVRRRKLG